MIRCITHVYQQETTFHYETLPLQNYSQQGMENQT